MQPDQLNLEKTPNVLPFTLPVTIVGSFEVSAGSSSSFTIFSRECTGATKDKGLIDRSRVIDVSVGCRKTYPGNPLTTSMSNPDPPAGRRVCDGAD